MSTKVTLSLSKDYHLYVECFDENLVYLQLDDPVCLQVERWEPPECKVTVAVPVESWRHIVEGWLKRQQNPNRDHDELMSNKITQNNTNQQDNDRYAEDDETWTTK